MAALKPTDLKILANRFVDKYYPQFVSRVDRIWDMLTEIDLSQTISKQESTGFQYGDALGIAGAIDPQLKECMHVISILAYVDQVIPHKDNLSENDIKIQLTSVPHGLKISTDQLQKLEQVLCEIFETDTKRPQKTTDGILIPNGLEGKKIQRDNVVYTSRESGFGVNRFLATEEEVHSRFLSDKSGYDIIIYHDSVELKIVEAENCLKQIEFSFIDLHSNIYKLLVLFLKYKDKKIPFAELYHCAWKKGLHYEEKLKNIDVLMEKVKPGVSTLRRKTERLKDFNIPYAKREDGSYICKGSFQFCMVLKESIDQLYTLAVV